MVYCLFILSARNIRDFSHGISSCQLSGSLSVYDPSADHTVIVVIEDSGLAGSGGAYGVIKPDADASVIQHFQVRCRRRMVVADFCARAQHLAGSHPLDGQEVDIAAKDRAAEKGRFIG